MRHPSVLFAPSSLRSFALVHLRSAPHRHHRPSPHSTPRLDKCICVKGERSCRMRSNPRAEFPRTRQRFYRAMGGRLCIFRGGERGRGQNERQRGGGCAKPLRGQAPETPKRLLHSRFASATHYKLENFVAGTLADAPNLPVSQIFMLDFHGTHRA